MHQARCVACALTVVWRCDGTLGEFLGSATELCDQKINENTTVLNSFSRISFTVCVSFHSAAEAFAELPK